MALFGTNFADYTPVEHPEGTRFNGAGGFLLVYAKVPSLTKGLQFFPDTIFHGCPVVGIHDIRVIKVEDMFEFMAEDELVDDDLPPDHFSKDAYFVIGIGICSNPHFFVSGLFPVKILPVRNDMNGQFLYLYDFIKRRRLGQGLEPSFLIFGADFSVLC